MKQSRTHILLKEILDVIEPYCDGINRSDFIERYSNEYTPASLKGIVEGGLYYVMDGNDELFQSIRNSVILTNRTADSSQGNIVFTVKNPQLLHYKITSLLEPKRPTGVHETAVISDNAVIHPSSYIGPYCCVEDAEIGENVCLFSHVVIKDHVRIEKNTVIDSGTVIGARGMAWIWDDDGHRVMQPQLGGVIIGEGCIIGTNISIVRGSLSENTIIGNGTVIAHGTMIGHGSVIGDGVHFANNVSLAGNARIGNRVFLGSSCVISSNVEVEEGCIVGAGTVVTKSFKEKNITIAGVPAKVLKRENYNDKPSGVPKPYKKTEL